MNRRSTARPAAGFTLIEVLVAFAVAALMLGALYTVFSSGVRSTVVIDHYRDAVLLAESAIDALSAVAVTADRSTDRIGIYERTTTVTPRPDLVPNGERRRVMAYEIAVRVAWRDGIARRGVSLSTLRLAPPPLQ